MKQWKYVGEEERHVLYPVAMTVQPGDIVEAVKNPDPARFEAVATKKEKE